MRWLPRSTPIDLFIEHCNIALWWCETKYLCHGGGTATISFWGNVYHGPASNIRKLSQKQILNMFSLMYKSLTLICNQFVWPPACKSILISMIYHLFIKWDNTFCPKIKIEFSRWGLSVRLKVKCLEWAPSISSNVLSCGTKHAQCTLFQGRKHLIVFCISCDFILLVNHMFQCFSLFLYNKVQRNVY